MEKIDRFLLNRKFMLFVALMAPVIFSVGALYLSGNLDIGRIATFLDPDKIPDIRLTDKGTGTKDNVLVSHTGGNSEVRSVFESQLMPIYGDAVNLKIESVKIDIKLAPVGLDADGTLLTPGTWNEGGWYKYGAKPSETGNLIINAHFDDNLGRPAAFWQLKNIKEGDKVLVSDSYGKSYTYSVKESILVSIDAPDRLKYFENYKDRKAMTLVTCGGVWVPGKSTYNKRLVVTAELVENE